MSNGPYFGSEVKNPCELTVLKEWTDYNGHFNVAYYTRAFDLAFAEFLLATRSPSGAHGGPDAGHEPCHIRRSRVQYLREVHLGRRLRFTTQLLAMSRDAVSVLQAMYVADDDYCAAIEERVMGLKGADSRMRGALGALVERHASLGVPDGWGDLEL